MTPRATILDKTFAQVLKPFDSHAPGSHIVLPNAICVGDINEDGKDELVLCNTAGCLVLYSAVEESMVLYKRTDNCVKNCSALAIGNIFGTSSHHTGRNVLIAASVEGFCNIYHFDVDHESMSRNKIERQVRSVDDNVLLRRHDHLKRNATCKSLPLSIDEPNAYEVRFNSVTENSEIFSSHDLLSQLLSSKYEREDRNCKLLSTPIELKHSQRLPVNICQLLICDINNDGVNEIVVVLTDRVIRSYKWFEDGLTPMNKWEFANQIGTVSIHPDPSQFDIDGQCPSMLLISQPTGSVFKLTNFNTDTSPSDFSLSSSNSLASDASQQSHSDESSQNIKCEQLHMRRRRRGSISGNIVSLEDNEEFEISYIIPSPISSSSMNSLSLHVNINSEELKVCDDSCDICIY